MSTQPHLSVDPGGASSPRNFSGLWDEALHRYKDETGKELPDLPTAQAFPSNPRNAEEIMTLFEKQGDMFDAFRDSGKKVRGVLRSIVDGVLLIKDCAEGASVSLTACIPTSMALTLEQDAIPGGEIMFGAIGVLLQV